MADTTAKIILSADDRTAAAFASVKNSLSTFNAQAAAAAGVLGSLGASLTFGGIAAFIKSTNDGVDALNDLKDATGSSIENISALEDVADRTGTSLETVGSALTKFNQALNAAKPDSDVALALKQIGLNAADLKKQDPSEALLKTAQALASFADDGNKARLVQELFGKSTRELAPFLKDLAETGQLVSRVTTQQAEEAEKFNRQLLELSANSKDASRALTSDLVTSLNLAAKAFRESGFLEGYRAIFSGGDEFKNNKRLFELTDELLKAENELSSARSVSSFRGRPLEVERAEKRIALLKEEIKTVQGYRQLLNQDGAKPVDLRPSTGSASAANGKPQAEQIDDARRSLASYVQALQGNLNTAEKLNETEKALNFLRSQGARGEIPQVRELVLGLAGQIDKEKELVAVLQDKRAASIAAGDAVNRANEEYQQRLKGLLDATPSVNLDKQRADVKLLTDEFEASRISEAQYLEAVSARLSLTNDQLKDTNTFAKDLGLTFSSAFEDAIAKGEGLSDVLKGLGADLLKLGARKFVTEPLGNAVTDIFKSLSFGLLGANGAGGGVGDYNTLGVLSGARADGGPVGGGKTYLVGERGPELFVPKVAGTIIPNGGFGGQSISQNLVFNIDSRTDQAEVRRITERAVRAGNAQLMDRLETAGRL